MSEFTALKYERQDGVVVLTLNQAKRGNPIDAAFCRDFKEAVLRLENEEGLRAVLLCADGPNFSFGGDVKGFFEKIDELPAFVREVLADLNIAAARFIRLGVPTVAAVQGYCMGGSIGVMACCDYVIADEAAAFGAAFSGIGFSCDSASSVSLAMRMGVARAKRFQLCAERLSAQDALAAGLVDEVVPTEELMERAMKQVARFAKGPTLAYGGIKELFNSASGIAIEAQLELEKKVLAGVAASADSREGVMSMIEKRKPAFKGE